MPEFVLDSWAIMAWLKDEKPAADRVLALLNAAERRELRIVMNIVNLGEIFYLSAKAKDLTYAERVVENLRSRIVAVPASDEDTRGNSQGSISNLICGRFRSCHSNYARCPASYGRSGIESDVFEGEGTEAGMDCQLIRS